MIKSHLLCNLLNSRTMAMFLLSVIFATAHCNTLQHTATHCISDPPWIQHLSRTATVLSCIHVYMCKHIHRYTYIYIYIYVYVYTYTLVYKIVPLLFSRDAGSTVGLRCSVLQCVAVRSCKYYGELEHSHSS